MKNNTTLWEAVGMLDEGYLTEAEGYGKKKRIKRSPVRFAAIAAAAVLVITGVGWTAQKWVFAPGQGLVPAAILTEMNIYSTVETDRQPLGKVTLEAVTVTEDPADPMNNRISLWVYRSPADQMGDGSIDVEGKGYLEGSSYTVSVNGTEYRKYSAHYGTSGWGRYTFGPVEDNGTPPALDGVCEVTIAYEEPDMQVEPVTVQLSPAEGARAAQDMITRQTGLTLMPLTDNLVIGNFTHPEWKPLQELAHQTQVMAHFTSVTGGGKTESVSGDLNLNGIRITDDCLSVSHDGYDQGIASMALYDLLVNFTFTHDSLPGYTFPLMEIGQTHTPVETVYLLDEGGLQVELLSVTRDGEGLHYETAYTYTGKDENVSVTWLTLQEYVVGPYAYQAGQAYVFNPEAKLHVETEADGSLTRFTGEEECVLQPGEPVTVFVQHAWAAYGTAMQAEGAVPVCEVILDGKS